MKALKQAKPAAESHKSHTRHPFLQRKPGAAADRPFIASPTTPQIQPKLTVNQPGDAYEQEADRMAERVMRMPSKSEAPPMISRMRAGGPVQRKCAACEAGGTTCSSCAAKEKEKAIQRQSTNSEPTHAPDTLAQRLQTRSGQGAPLSPAVHQQMGGAFGQDFSGVRLHTDAEAVQMSRELNAQAFTYGQDIYFNSGKYQPETTAGKGLLGHELTHTVQQGGGVVADHPIQRKTKNDTIKHAYLPPNLVHLELTPDGEELFEGFQDETDAIRFAKKQSVKCTVIWLSARQRYHIVDTSLDPYRMDPLSLSRSNYVLSIEIRYDFDPFAIEHTSFQFGSTIYTLSDTNLFMEIGSVIPQLFSISNIKTWLDTGSSDELESQRKNIITEGIERQLIGFNVESEISFNIDKLLNQGILQAEGSFLSDQITYHTDALEKQLPVWYYQVSLDIIGNYKTVGLMTDANKIICIMAVYRETSDRDWLIPLEQIYTFKENYREYELKRESAAVEGVDWETESKMKKAKFGDIHKKPINSRLWYELEQFEGGAWLYWSKVRDFAHKLGESNQIWPLAFPYAGWKYGRSWHFTHDIFNNFHYFSWNDLVSMALPGNLDHVIRRARGADESGKAMYHSDDLVKGKYENLPADLFYLFYPGIKESLQRIVRHYTALSYLAAKKYLSENPESVVKDNIPHTVSVWSESLRQNVEISRRIEIRERVVKTTYQDLNAWIFYPDKTQLIPSKLQDKEVINVILNINKMNNASPTGSGPSDQAKFIIDYHQYHASGMGDQAESSIKINQEISKFNWILPETEMSWEGLKANLQKMHWIEVQEPVSATAEDVAGFLYEDSSRAYAIINAAPYFAFSPFLLPAFRFKQFYDHMSSMGVYTPFEFSKQEWLDRIAADNTGDKDFPAGYTPEWIVNAGVIDLGAGDEEAGLKQAAAYKNTEQSKDVILDRMRESLLLLDRIKYYTETLNLENDSTDKAKAKIEARIDRLFQTDNEFEVMRWDAHSYAQLTLLNHISAGLESPARTYESFEFSSWWFSSSDKDRKVYEIAAHQFDQLAAKGIPNEVLLKLRPMVNVVFEERSEFSSELFKRLGSELFNAHSQAIHKTAQKTLGVERNLPLELSLSLFDVASAFLSAVKVIDFIETAENRVAVALEKSGRLNLDILAGTMMPTRDTLSLGAQEVTEADRKICGKVRDLIPSSLQEDIVEIQSEALELQNRLVRVEWMRTQSPLPESFPETMKQLDIDIKWFSKKATILAIHHNLQSLWNFLLYGGCTEGFLADIHAMNTDKSQKFYNALECIGAWGSDFYGVYLSFKNINQDAYTEYERVMALMPQIEEKISGINSMISHYAKWERRLNIAGEIAKMVAITVATWGVGSLVAGSRGALALRSVLGGGLLGSISTRILVSGVEAAFGTGAGELLLQTDPNKGILHKFLEDWGLSLFMDALNFGISSSINVSLGSVAERWPKVTAGVNIAVGFAAQMVIKTEMANTEMMQKQNRNLTDEEKEGMIEQETIMFVATSLLAALSPVKNYLEGLKLRSYKELSTQYTDLSKAQSIAYAKISQLEEGGSPGELKKAMRDYEVALTKQSNFLDTIAKMGHEDLQKIGAEPTQLANYSTWLSKQLLSLSIRSQGGDVFSISSQKLHIEGGLITHLDKLGLPYKRTTDELTGREIIEVHNLDGSTFRIREEGRAFHQLLDKHQSEMSQQVRDEIEMIGPIKDEATLIRLINDHELRKALVQYPMAAKALKKCSSPCFPEELTIRQIKALDEIMVGLTLDQKAKINSYLFKTRKFLGPAISALRPKRLAEKTRTLDEHLDKALLAFKELEADVHIDEGAPYVPNAETKGLTAGTGGISSIVVKGVEGGQPQIFVTGTILPSISNLFRPGFEENLRLGSDVGLRDYERAHLWGPGWGDETVEGIMFAPKGLNQELQNKGVERYIREMREAGYEVRVEATATGYSRNEVPGYKFRGREFLLQRVEYKVSARLQGSDDAFVDAFEAGVSVGKPPKGTLEPDLKKLSGFSQLGLKSN